MKKNVQKTIAVLGAAVLATGMIGCGSSNTNTSAADSSAAESGAAADTTENSADAKKFEWFYHPGRFHFNGKICKCTGRNVHGEISERDRTG